jgi:hypothetical protein
MGRVEVGVVLPEPAKCPADPPMSEALTFGGLGARKEGTITRQEPIWSKHGCNTPDHIRLIWNEMERIAQEDCIGICYDACQLIRVALHELHGAAAQALASDL